MIEHMVWIKFHPGVSAGRAQQHLDALANLEHTVPQAKRVRVGPNITDRSNGYTHGLIVELEDAPALKHYQDHPRHLEVAGPLKEDADLLAMDIELP